MGLTIVEKIIAKAVHKERVTPGEIVSVIPDLIMSNDATAHITIDIFKKRMNGEKVKESSKVIFVIDHNVPSNSIDTAMVHKKMRDFAKEQDILIYDGEGICHQLLIENHILPNQFIVAADSHTCSYGALGAFGTGIGSTDNAAVWKSGDIWIKVPSTIKFEINGPLPNGVYAKDVILKIISDIGVDGATYKCMEFGGSTIENLSVDSRITLCNMAVEAGAKTGIIAGDQRVLSYLNDRGIGKLEMFKSDHDAEYDKVYQYNGGDFEPVVACPHNVGNVRPLREIEGLKIDEAFIGSCTNGRLEDLIIAGRILEGTKINSGVRLIVSSASNKVFKQALNEGLIETFMKSGAIVMNPNCSACWGACQGVLADGQRLITSGNRNFKGRVGSPNSEIYLASPATVAISAINGKISQYV
ncbi:MAG: 3-isopropylmalate dehydratase large subunit [bacterium]